MKYRFLRFPDFRTKAVTLSYDDANRNDVRLVEIMNRYGLKGTFNVPGTGFPEEEREDNFHITRAQAESLYFPNGHDVAIHGAQHMSLILSAPKDGIREVTESRAFLERFYGRIIRGMAYADTGLTNPEIEGYLRLLGITYARTVEISHSFDLPRDWLAWKMTSCNTDPNLFELVDAFISRNPTEQYIAKRGPMLFSMWGHSFEFPPDKWEVMERFGEKIGGRADIWYVNNTDLYEYCHAYDSLVFSCENTMVYNPTQIGVWFEADCKNYYVKPGELLTFV